MSSCHWVACDLGNVADPPCVSVFSSSGGGRTCSGACRGAVVITADTVLGGRVSPASRPRRVHAFSVLVITSAHAALSSSSRSQCTFRPVRPPNPLSLPFANSGFNGKSHFGLSVDCPCPCPHEQMPSVWSQRGFGCESQGPALAPGSSLVRLPPLLPVGRLSPAGIPRTEWVLAGGVASEPAEAQVITHDTLIPPFVGFP